MIQFWLVNQLCCSFWSNLETCHLWTEGRLAFSVLQHPYRLDPFNFGSCNAKVDASDHCCVIFKLVAFSIECFGILEWLLSSDKPIRCCFISIIHCTPSTLLIHLANGKGWAFDLLKGQLIKENICVEEGLFTIRVISDVRKSSRQLSSVHKYIKAQLYRDLFKINSFRFIPVFYSSSSSIVWLSRLSV